MSNFTITTTAGLADRLNGFLNAPVAAAKAVAQTALDVRELLANATPVDTGDTARRWQVTKLPTLNDPTAVVSNDSVVMVYLEYGTKPHKITAKNGKALAFAARAGKNAAGRQLYTSATTGKAILSAKRAATVMVQSVNHPGTRPTFTVRGNLGKVATMLNRNILDEIRRLERG